MVSMMLHSLLYGGRETPGNNLGVHYALSLWHLIYSKAAPYSTKKRERSTFTLQGRRMPQ